MVCLLMEVDPVAKGGSHAPDFVLSVLRKDWQLAGWLQSLVR